MRVMIEKAREFIDSKRGALITLIFIYVVGVLFTVFVIDNNVYGPMHFNDEVKYWEMVLDLHQGDFSFAKGYSYPPLYSISILPAFYLFSPFTRYAAVKWLNAIYLTSAIFPLYLLLRKFLDRKISLIAVVILLCGPIQVVIPRTLLSENIFYPLFMWAVLLAFVNLFPVDHKAHIIENIIFGVVLALLYATRFIALVLIPFMLLIWWLKPFDSEKLPLLFSWKKFSNLLMVLAPLLIILGVWMWIGLADGVPLTKLTGLAIANNSNPAQLGKRRLLMWAVYYLSYTILISAPYLGLMLASLSRFKLKNWQNDENRWWISLALIIISLLLACVRHSWRIGYNYPDPVKLQGRYIMYFGPLFLITAYGFLGKQMKAKKPGSFSLVICLITCGLIVFAHLVWNKNYFFPYESPGASVNSPYGSMMLVLKDWYFFLNLAFALMVAWLIGKKKRAYIIHLSLFLLVFNTYGSLRIYQRLLTSRQLLNAQVHNVIKVFESCQVEELEEAVVRLEIPTDSTSRVIRSWHQALNFNGYTENELIPTENISADEMVFRAHYDDCVIDVLHLSEEEFDQLKGTKFSHSGYFYELKVQCDK